jgi:hypothetical protein
LQIPLAAQPVDPVKLPHWIAGALGAVIVLSVNILWVSHFMGFLHPPESVSETDHFRYIAMAQGPEGYASLVPAHEAPFCYRLLVPWMAYQLTRLGLDLNISFYLLSQTFLFLFLLTLFRYLLAVGIEFRFALLGLFIVGLLPGAVRWYAYQYWMTDPAALFIVTLGLLFIRTGNDKAFRCLGVLGATARETCLIIIPYYFLYHLKRDGARRAAVLTLQAAAVPLIVFMLIRYFVILSVPSVPLLSLARDILAWRIKNLFVNQLYFITFGSLGVLAPLLAMRPWETLSHFRDNYDELGIVVMVAASLAMAYNTDRLLAYSIPVILPVALRNAGDLLTLGGIPFSGILILVLLPQVLHFVLTRFVGTFAISVVQPTNVIVTVCMVIFWVACAWRLTSGRA